MTTNHSTISSLLSDIACDRADAEMLLAHLLDRDRAFVCAFEDHVVEPDKAQKFLDLHKRRADGEPLAYLTGTKEFYGRNLHVTPDTLIPRADTEPLVDRARVLANKHITSGAKEPLIICDIGTGSGAIIITLAAELANAHATHNCGFIATDISMDALTVAHTNARMLELDDQISFIHSDLLATFLTSEPLKRMLRLGAHMLICANLPYVDTDDRAHLLAQNESCGLAFEPELALWADDFGLALYERFFEQIAQIHTDAPKAHITALCEINPKQETALADRAHKHLPTVRTRPHADLSGRTRFIEVRL